MQRVGGFGSLKNCDSQKDGMKRRPKRPSTILGSVRHRVQSERGGVLLGPQTQILDAGGLVVVAGQASCGRGLQQGAVPHLLGVMGQRLVVGLAGQRAQRRRGHVDVHPQVGERGRGREVEGRVVHQVVGGRHVLAELLLQAEEAERRGGVRVALGEGSAAGQAAAGGGGGGGHGWRDQGGVWMEGEQRQVRDDADEDWDGYAITRGSDLVLDSASCTLETRPQESRLFHTSAPPLGICSPPPCPCCPPPPTRCPSVRPR